MGDPRSHVWTLLTAVARQVGCVSLLGCGRRSVEAGRCKDDDALDAIRRLHDPAAGPVAAKLAKEMLAAISPKFNAESGRWEKTSLCGYSSSCVTASHLAAMLLTGRAVQVHFSRSIASIPAALRLRPWQLGGLVVAVVDPPDAKDWPRYHASLIWDMALREIRDGTVVRGPLWIPGRDSGVAAEPYRAMPDDRIHEVYAVCERHLIAVEARGKNRVEQRRARWSREIQRCEAELARRAAGGEREDFSRSGVAPDSRHASESGSTDQDTET